MTFKSAVPQATIVVELWDSAASGGVGRKLGHATVALDLHAFEPFKAQSASVELLGKEKKVAPSVVHPEGSGTLCTETDLCCTAPSPVLLISLVCAADSCRAACMRDTCIQRRLKVWVSLLKQRSAGSDK